MNSSRRRSCIRGSSILRVPRCTSSDRRSRERSANRRTGSLALPVVRLSSAQASDQFLERERLDEVVIRPGFEPATRSGTASRAVKIRTGTRFPAARRERQTSMPLRPGMSTSRTTASKGAPSIVWSAYVPSFASSTS
jgi:hypothetical protein